MKGAGKVIWILVAVLIAAVLLAFGILINKGASSALRELVSLV